jgi:hypothetical protein
MNIFFQTDDSGWRVVIDHYFNFIISRAVALPLWSVPSRDPYSLKEPRKMA